MAAVKTFVVKNSAQRGERFCVGSRCLFLQRLSHSGFFLSKGMNRDLVPSSSNAGQGLLALNMMWVEPARAWLANVQSSIVILLCGGEKWTIATDLFYSILNIALSFHRS